MRQVLGPVALGRPRGMGWGGRWEGGSGWGTHVNPWLIHVSVWQKPLQYCKVISFQLIKVNEKKKYWSGLLCPPPGNLPDPGIKPVALASPALVGGFFFFFLISWRPITICKTEKETQMYRTDFWSRWVGSLPLAAGTEA